MVSVGDFGKVTGFRAHCSARMYVMTSKFKLLSGICKV